MITDKLRQSIFERDNYTCQYCGRSAYDTDLEIEHIIPISKGGNDDTRNLVTACSECNRSKGARILTIGELQQIADKINSSLEYLMSLANEEPQNERSVKFMLCNPFATPLQGVSNPLITAQGVRIYFAPLQGVSNSLNPDKGH